LHARYGDSIEFLIVYCREAHAMDSWLPMAFGNIEDPVTHEERDRMATFCSRELGLTMPAVVDEIDDAVSRSYSGWPERLYLIAQDGKVVYRGGPGPFGYDPDGFADAIRSHLGLPDK
jgi:hypothetical protein